MVFVAGVAAYALTAHADLHRAWTMIDLQVYRWAGGRVRAGQPIYHTRDLGLPFTYPPLAALLFAALALPMSALRYLATAGSIACLILALWLAWGLAGRARGGAGARSGAGARGWDRLGWALAAAGCALALEPVWANLKFGQINLALMALVLFDLSRADRTRWKGAGVGLATAIKLTPVVFVGYLLVTRRWRAAGTAVAAAAGATVVAWAVLPAASRSYWLGGLWANADRVGGLGYASNQSLDGVLVRLLHAPAGAWWMVSAGVVGVGGLLVAHRAHAAGEELAAISIVAMTGLLVSPVSWSHHWVWVAPGLVALVDLAVRARRRRLWGIPTLVAGAFLAGPVSFLWQVPNGDNREYQWHGWQLVAGNLYVLVGLALLGLAAARFGVAGPPRRATADPAVDSGACPPTAQPASTRP